MLKFGLISEIDFSTGLARVNFPDDDFVSAWLKISVMRSAGDQVSFPFEVNEHVWCIMDENWEYGVIGGAVYDETNKPSGSAAGLLQIKFTDNSTITYNRNSHILKLDIKGQVEVKATEVSIESGTVEIDAATTTIKGILNVQGAANIQGMASVGGLSGISGGNVKAGDSVIEVKELQATGDVKSEGDIKAGAISLKTHIHTVPSGGGTSGPAQ